MHAGTELFRERFDLVEEFVRKPFVKRILLDLSEEDPSGSLAHSKNGFFARQRRRLDLIRFSIGAGMAFVPLD
jgi:hypothetical protein